MKYSISKLKDLVTIKGGKRIPKGHDLTEKKNEHPYIRIRDMYQNKYLELNDDYLYVPDDIYEKIKNYIVSTNDVIIANVGNTIGLVSIIGYSLNGANLTENCVKFINLKNIMPDYLFYFLRSEYGQAEIKKGIVGSSQPKLPIYNIENIDVILPSIQIQQKICKILNVLDEKISICERINSNIYKQADNIMKKLDLDMDNTIILSDLITFINGFAFKSSSYIENGEYKVITIKNVQNKNIDSSKCDRVDSIPEKMSKDCILKKGDILLSLTGNVGRVGIVCEDKLLLNQRVAKINMINKKHRGYIYFLFSQDIMRLRLENLSKGTAQQNLSPIETLSLDIKYDSDKVEKVCDLFNNYFEKIVLNNTIINDLVEFRNNLIPKLMNGEIDLDNIEI